MQGCVDRPRRHQPGAELQRVPQERRREPLGQALPLRELEALGQGPPLREPELVLPGEVQGPKRAWESEAQPVPQELEPVLSDEVQVEVPSQVPQAQQVQRPREPKRLHRTEQAQEREQEPRWQQHQLPHPARQRTAACRQGPFPTWQRAQQAPRE